MRSFLVKYFFIILLVSGLLIFWAYKRNVVSPNNITRIERDVPKYKFKYGDEEVYQYKY